MKSLKALIWIFAVFVLSVTLPSHHTVHGPPSHHTVHGPPSHRLVHGLHHGVLYAQQPTSTASLFVANSQYLQGRTWADLKPSAGAGLTLNVAPGTVAINGTVYLFATSTALTMTASATNYVFVNTAGALAQNTTGFTGGVVPIAIVTTDATTITATNDRRAILSGVGSLSSGFTGILPVANGGTGTGTQFTSGSVVFAGTSGVYSQNNANLFWDNTNARLGIGTATPQRALHVNGLISITNGNQLMFESVTGAFFGAFRHNGFDNSLAIYTQSDGSNPRLTILNGGNVGIGKIPGANAQLDVAKSIVSGLNTVTFSATPTFNAALGNTQKITLTGNVTSSTLSNASAGQQINFLICQDATGSRTFVWPTNVKGGMTIGGTLSTCSAQNFIFDGTNAYALSAGVTNM